jgi:hypothetical protein
MSCVGCKYTIKTRKEAECTCPMTYACNTDVDKSMPEPKKREGTMAHTNKH